MDDTALPQHHRAGAHRARRHPAVTTLLMLGSVAMLSGLLVWLLLAVDVLGVRDDLVAGPPTAPSATPGAAVASPEPSPEPEPSAPVVDLDVPLEVLNSTGAPGLAAGAAQRLEDAGWMVAEVGNYAEGELPTTVFYGSADLAATADAVAGSLGAGRAALSDNVGEDAVRVVLGPDYAG